jgi:ribosomal protein L29
MKLDLSKFSVQELEEMLDERKKELGILTLNPRMAEIVDEIEQIQFFMNAVKEPTNGEA